MAPGAEALQDLDQGTAYIGSVRSTETGVEAVLIYPGGRSRLLEFDCVLSEADRRAPDGVGTVLAVHVRSRASELTCKLLGTAQGGARSLPISLAQALALAEGGAHGVVSVERARAC